jgi:hypothetical protein
MKDSKGFPDRESEQIKNAQTLGMGANFRVFVLSVLANQNILQRLECLCLLLCQNVAIRAFDHFDTGAGMSGQREDRQVGV